MAICVSPLIELARPDVGSDSQKRRQACFQACNGARGGRLSAQPPAKHSLWICVTGTLYSRGVGVSHPHPKSWGDLCRGPASDANWISPKGVCGPGHPCQRLSVSIRSKMLCETRCLNCPLLGYSSLKSLPRESAFSEEPRP